MSAKRERILICHGPPWGFRIGGGKGTGRALTITRVNERGREHGLKEGDRILVVNGQACDRMSQADAQGIVKNSPSNLELVIERNEEPLCSNGGFNHTNGNNNYDVFSELSEKSLDSQVNTAEDSTMYRSSWSSDSTSTGSTTIHVAAINTQHTSMASNVWSPSTVKKRSLRLNLHPETPKAPPSEKFQEPSPDTQATVTPRSSENATGDPQDEKSPIWQPFGAPYDGSPQFRRVKLDVKINSTKSFTQEDMATSPELRAAASPQPEAVETTPRPPSDHAPANPTIVPNSTPTTFTKTGWSSHLPPSQSPTITLLQKAREGQLPKGAIYMDERINDSSSPLPKNAVLIDQKVTVEGDKVHTDSYYAVPTVSTDSSTVTIKAPPKYDGIGPTEYGIPVGLRTAVKEEYASDWYKTMYNSLHRNKPGHSGKTVHMGGYMSEPEFDRKDTYGSKYLTPDYRRRPEKSVSYASDTSPRSSKMENIVEKKSPRSPRSPNEPPVVRSEPQQNFYRNEPRSIAEYEPGRSSLAEQEFQKFWSDFWDSMEDLHEHLGGSPRPPQQGLNKRWPNVLLSDGYESDSTLIRKTGRDLTVNPEQQKEWYKEIQKGGEIPMIGLRKSVPEKPKDSPHQYQETEVNIHFKSPIRNLEKEFIEEEELRKRQEDAMRKFYEEERRKKHLQEMAEIEMRRHSDFFTPSQKSPISLNRYDNPFDSRFNRLTVSRSYSSPLARTIARALYPFTAQSTRELSLNKGDIIYIIKQVDNNWFEGEHHGLIGIFPTRYVEIIPDEKANLQPRKATEGHAIVKYNFRAQTKNELSLFKGENVILTKRIDRNWYEGRLGAKKGIFPASYVNVLQEPGEFTHGKRALSPKPSTSPVFVPIINGSASRMNEGPIFNAGLRPAQNKLQTPLEKLEDRYSLTQSLHIDTYNEPIPYRSLYTYKPQNDDELELQDGDTVYVMEKCDDGWYVGTSLRTGQFGTFPGNYVERI